ncbi:MAG: hypothetical protein WD578_05780 [Bacteroidales bacterium]
MQDVRFEIKPTLLIILALLSVNISGQIEEQMNGRVILNGIVQTSGLSEQDKSRFKIDSDFQIITNEIPYFLIANDDLSNFWGQCVEIEGKILEGWDNYPIDDRLHFTFGRSAISVESIKFDSCRIQNYIHTHITCLQDTVECNIERSVRPAPDIYYDYRIIPLGQVKLQIEPAYNPPIFNLIHALSVDQVNTILNAKSTVKLVGCFTGGYAESVVFKLNHIIE